LTYEVKHASIATGAKEKIYRVTNNFEVATLCGAGRFGFDFDVHATKDEELFVKAVNAFKGANVIRFSSIITNEEAVILQRLKEKLGVKLFNEEARAYQSFMSAFGSMSGKNSFSGSLDSITQSDAVIVLGGRVSSDNPAVRYAITTAARHNGAKVIYMHPLEDALMQNVITQMVKYEAGSEEGVVAMLAKTLLGGCDVSDDVQSFLDGLDEGYLCAESNVGDEEFAHIAKTLIRTKKKTLVIGRDVLNHKNSANIAKLCGLIEMATDFSVVVVPQHVNTVGVSLICDLDVDVSCDNVVGYNASGDFTVGSMGVCDMLLPALNSQEGTVTSLNYQVLTTNVAIGFEGYCLNDIANALGIRAVNTIDYTSQLPANKGFKAIKFDALDNFYGPLGEDNRGYRLEMMDVACDGVISDISSLPEYNGTIVYACNPVNQFNSYTAHTTQLEKDNTLRGSAQFATAARLAHGDRVIIEGHVGTKTFIIDETLKGTIALNPFYEESNALTGYRFLKIKLTKVES
jgi:NADH-quinone oxidoreductase subunit G